MGDFMKTNRTVKYIFILFIVMVIFIIAQLLTPSFDSRYKSKIKQQDIENVAKELASCYIMVLNDNKAVNSNNMNVYANDNKIEEINNSINLKFLFRKQKPDKGSDIIILAINPQTKEKFIAITFDNSVFTSDEIKVFLNDFEYFPDNWPLLPHPMQK